jgi:hypothetical protein
VLAWFDVATRLEDDIRWLVFNIVVIVRLSKAGKSHDHQFDEEQDEDGHEANAFDPRVFSDRTREALIGQSFIGRGQKLERVVSIRCCRSDSSPDQLLTCMKAVATMTPEPKYLAMKKAHEGTPAPGCLAAKTGNHEPRKDPTRMTKIDEMRTPMRPSKSFSEGQSDMATSLKVTPGASAVAFVVT